ncbi:uncharacterized protein TNCV_1325161 [Trichonephila clavipes]|nr:uncharacterized protein TNCV_1325161 [Trichonephila clavipes]
MYFTLSGKIKISTSDLSLSPIYAVQITAIEQILNIPVKANIIWEGFTLRFLLFDIPTNAHLTDVTTELKNSNGIEIVEIRRFIKKNGRQEASPVLITILGINTPECVKLWFFNHRTQLFIDKPRQCNNCYSFTHSSSLCPSDVRCINCGGSRSGQCTNPSNCTNCKGDHPANSPNCPTFIKEKKFSNLNVPNTNFGRGSTKIQGNSLHKLRYSSKNSSPRTKYTRI